MDPFKKLELSDFQVLRPAYRADPDEACRLCDVSPAVVTMWRRVFDTRFLMEGDTVLFSLRDYAGRPSYSYPIGREKEKMLLSLRALCPKPRFVFVSADQLNEIQRLFGPGEVTAERKDFDYLYEKKDFLSLAGRKYQAIRNHIHKFEQSFPDWRYRPLTEETLPDARRFYREYQSCVTKDDPLFLQEKQIVTEVLENFPQYGMTGGVLYAGGGVAGFTVGETYRDTLYVHIEKGNVEIPGVYQKLSHCYAETAGEKIYYVNREEDMGDEGLRRSKLSYRPCALLEKYSIQIL